MSRICQLTGLKPITGHRVSHSNVKTNRWFFPNLQEKNYYIPELDQWVHIKLSTSAMRTINKKGLLTYIREIEKKEGIKLI
ncbi:MAG: 50S ribosomal protein L28 [Bacteroidetes bacterium]|nr:50S ribosomal protein L28 [Bacteroidota bacterium]